MFQIQRGRGYILKKMGNNHSPEREAIRDLERKLRTWDKKKFAKKVEYLENLPKPDWMKHVQR